MLNKRQGSKLKPESGVLYAALWRLKFPNPKPKPKPVATKCRNALPELPQSWGTIISIIAHVRSSMHWACAFRQSAAWPLDAKIKSTSRDSPVEENDETRNENFTSVTVFHRQKETKTTQSHEIIGHHDPQFSSNRCKKTFRVTQRTELAQHHNNSMAEKNNHSWRVRKSKTW